MISTIFILLIAFQIKHFLCDYPLQGKYMLGKFNKEDWKLPLAAHAGTHAIGTSVIASLISTSISLIISVVLNLNFGGIWVLTKCHTI